MIDADQLGHRALEAPHVIQSLVRQFGAEILDDRGAIDRRRVAARVFGSAPEHAAARAELERIVHAEIAAAIDRRIADQDAPKSTWFLDAALLFEAGWNSRCRGVAFIDAPRELRLERVRSSRNWTDDELTRREASQWPLDRKRALCDVVIVNQGPAGEAGRQLAEFARVCCSL